MKTSARQSARKRSRLHWNWLLNRREPRSIRSVSAPSLVLHRRSCLNLDSGHARYLAEHLPEARLVTPGGTDSLWFTDSSEVLDEAIAFLRTGLGPR